MDSEKLKILEALKIKRYFLKQRKYYDYPDGQDLMGKLLYTNKWCGLLGLALGSGVCISYPPVKGIGPKLFVISRYTVPLIGMASAYTFTTYYSTVLRKVDDPWNHFYGGLAAGSIVGVVKKNGFQGTLLGLFFGLIGHFIKTMKLSDIETLQIIGVQNRGSPYNRRIFDFSRIPERKSNWTRELPTETVN